MLYQIKQIQSGNALFKKVRIEDFKLQEKVTFLTSMHT